MRTFGNPRKSFRILRVLVGLAGLSSGCGLEIRVPQSLNSLNSVAGSNSNCIGVTPKTLNLLPVYPLHANWNDYVHAVVAPTSTPYNQADSDCLTTEATYFGCVHGGEKRKFSLPGYTSCAGLRVQDSLGAFAWSCDATQNPVVFYSRTFNLGKGLKDLINSSLQFNLLGLTVTDPNACVIGVAAPAVQWANPIVNLLPGFNSTTAVTNLPGSGSSPGTIYALNSGTGTPTAGLNISVNHTGLVMLGNSSLLWVGAGAAPVVQAGGSHLWLEGDINGYNAAGNANFGVSFETTYSRNHLVKIHNTNWGLSLNSNSLFDQVSIENVTSSAIDDFGDTGITLYNLSLNNVNRGITLDNMNTTVLSNIMMSNVGQDGFRMSTNFGSGGAYIATQMTILNQTGSGFPAFRILAKPGTTSGINTFAHLSILNSKNSTVLSEDANGGGIDATTFSNVLIANATNNADLISLNGIITGSFYDLLLLGNSGGGGHGVINVGGNSSSSINFDGSMRISGNSIACSNTDPTFKLNNSCQYGPTFGETAITAGVNLGSSFQGLVSSDPVNQSSGGGFGNQLYTVAPSGSPIDFLNFADIFYRGWGLSGTGGFLDPSRLGACGVGQNCQMYDTRLYKSDTTALNFYGALATSIPNCPSSVDGAGDIFPAGGANPTIIHDGNSHYYLKNAVEIQFDDAPGANNNGLCESGEKCIYAPNSGAYQGGDDFSTQTCIFHSGPNDGAHISNVTMYYYPVNGI